MFSSELIEQERHGQRAQGSGTKGIRHWCISAMRKDAELGLFSHSSEYKFLKGGVQRELGARLISVTLALM